VAALAGVAPAEKATERGERHHPAVLVLLLLLAAALRLPHLPLRQVVEGDGVHYASLARLILIGDFEGLANPYWSNLWPAVIAATSRLTGLDVVGAGRLASLLAGTALAPATALLGARLFGRTAGLLAGLAVAVHPWLIEFSTLVFTEAFFALLLVALLLVGWRMVERASLRVAVLAGVLAGAAAVTRPETYGAIAVLSVFLLGAGWRRREAGKAAGALAVFLLLVMGFVVARALLVHRYFGEWDFGQSKGTANLIMGLAEKKETISRGITAGGQNRLDVAVRQTTFLGFVRENPGLILRHVGKNLVALGVCLWHVFPPVPVSMGREAFQLTRYGPVVDAVGVACLVLAVLGLAHGLRTRGTRSAAGLCGAVVAVHVLGLAPLYVHDRMIVVLAPIFLLLFAHGLVVLATALPAPLADRRGVLLPLLFLPLPAVSLFGLFRSPLLAYISEPLVQKQAGLWLREHFPQETRLMVISPSIAFYFYDAEHQENSVDLPWAEYPVFLDLARQKDVDVIAASEWQLLAAGFPTARDLVPEAPHPGLKYVTTLGKPPRRVHVFTLGR
jgi:4-amino-4-deoxy-L-arabinose transferase-like glycosyltransferase